VSGSRGRAWLAMLIVAALVVAIDQGVKAIVEGSLELGERNDLALGFDVTRVMNSGVAFGLFSEGSDAAVIAFTGAALLLIVGWFAFDTTRPGLWLGVGLLTGGALGNLADRILDGAVTDYLDPPIWPAFNAADIAITLGVVVIAFAALAPERPQATEP
jgi:signal peptidase II